MDMFKRPSRLSPQAVRLLLSDAQLTHHAQAARPNSGRGNHVHTVDDKVHMSTWTEQKEKVAADAPWMLHLCSDEATTIGYKDFCEDLMGNRLDDTGVWREPSGAIIPGKPESVRRGQRRWARKREHFPEMW